MQRPKILKLDGPHVGEFWAFHRVNPLVYDILVTKARQASKKGFERIGIKMLWEVMRWEIKMRTVDPSQDEFKLNNNYHSYYARLIMFQEPDLKGIFELRDHNRR